MSQVDLAALRAQVARYQSMDWIGAARAAAGLALAEKVPALLDEIEAAGKPLRDALEARGLPVTADLATLITHERANAKLAGTFDALRETAPTVCPYDCDSCHGDDCPCERLGCAGYKLHGENSEVR